MTRQTASDTPAAPSGAPHDAPARRARPGGRLIAAVIAFVVVFTGLGYGLLGNFEGWTVAPGRPYVQPEPAHDMAQFEAMAARLAERLQQEPDNAEGWHMLARTYMVMQRFSDAVPAFRQVARLRPNDADAYADWADAQAMLNGRTLQGEPEALVRKALEVDPDHVKALALAGTIAYQRNDFAGALAHWERARRVAGADSELGQRLAGAVADARQRAATPAAPATPATPAPPAAATAAATITGEVTLSDALKQGASPDDTVFIFARPADGSRMPLALVRKQVRDLPFRFTLDDTVAMNPAMPLSSARSVIVGARVTKTGNAMPQRGDLEGYSPPVQVGQAGVNVEIARIVR